MIPRKGTRNVEAVLYTCTEESWASIWPVKYNKAPRLPFPPVTSATVGPKVVALLLLVHCLAWLPLKLFVRGVWSLFCNVNCPF